MNDGIVSLSLRLYANVKQKSHRKLEKKHSWKCDYNFTGINEPTAALCENRVAQQPINVSPNCRSISVITDRRFKYRYQLDASAIFPSGLGRFVSADWAARRCEWNQCGGKEGGASQRRPVDAQCAHEMPDNVFTRVVRGDVPVWLCPSNTWSTRSLLLFHYFIIIGDTDLGPADEMMPHLHHFPLC